MSDPVREALEYLAGIGEEWHVLGGAPEYVELAEAAIAALDRERGKLAQAREIVETLGRLPLDDGSVLVLDTDWRALRRALGMEVDGDA